MEALIREMLDGRILLSEAVGEFEKIYIEQALGRNGEHLTRTAEALGIHRNTLSAKLSSYSKTDATTRPSRRRPAKSKLTTLKQKARAAGSSR